DRPQGPGQCGARGGEPPCACPSRPAARHPAREPRRHHCRGGRAVGSRGRGPGRVPDDRRIGARLARQRHHGDDGRPQPHPRRVALGKRRGGDSRAGGGAQDTVLRLRAGEPAARRLRPSAPRTDHRSAPGHQHRDETPGRRDGPRRPRRNRGRQAGRPRARAHQRRDAGGAPGLARGTPDRM
ncbi:MAG: Alpha-D-ribose 1-methylphosphonate 5-triphosphate diphosphatase, partial [uncultured Microvirga sp.]